jgi:hypothetical protein
MDLSIVDSIVLDVKLNVPTELKPAQISASQDPAPHAAISDDTAARFRRWKAARDFVGARQRHGHDQASAR